MNQATQRTRQEVEERLQGFVQRLTQYCAEKNINADIYTYVISLEYGAKNVRVVKAEKWGDKEPTSRSVHCFVRLSDGAILKGSWKAPVKNPERGSIFADEFDIGVGRACNEYGCAYLR